MNFYKHHLGDYSAATAHLNWDEDCAYRRLIDVYYKREAPIPADIKEACRLTRAVSAAQRTAVETVLREFFTLEADGWHQKRCDEELQLAHEQAATNRRIAEQREAARRARTVHEPYTDRPPATIGEREPSHKPLATSHKPLATSHKPLATSHKPVVKDKARLLAADDLQLPPDLAEEWIAHRKRKRAALTHAAWESLKAEALKAGVSPEDAVRKALARGWTGFEAGWLVEKANGSKQSALEARNRAAAAEFLSRGSDAPEAH